MADNDALHEVHDVFGNVGGVVGDALQVAGGGEQRQAGLYVVRRLAHRVEQLGDDLHVVPVYLVIEATDAAGLAGVEVDEGVQTLADHRRCQVRHALQFFGDRDRGQLGQAQGPFGDVLGQVGHAL